MIRRKKKITQKIYNVHIYYKSHQYVILEKKLNVKIYQVPKKKKRKNPYF